MDPDLEREIASPGRLVRIPGDRDPELRAPRRGERDFPEDEARDVGIARVDGEDSSPARVRVSRVTAFGLGLVDPERVRARVGVEDESARRVRFAREVVVEARIDLQGGEDALEIRSGRGRPGDPPAALLGRREGLVLVAAGRVLVPVVDGRVVHPAPAARDRLRPCRVCREVPLVAPIDPPGERALEADRQGIVEAVGGEAPEAPRIHESHARPEPREPFPEAPTEGEGVLRPEVVERALAPVDVDFVVPLHHEVESAEERLVREDAPLAADEVPRASDFEEGLARLGRELEALPPVGRVEVAECGRPAGKRLPLDVAVVHRVSVRVVPEDDARPLAEGHREVRVVAPGCAFDEEGAEVLRLSVAAVAEEVREGREDGGRLRAVEPDLEDDPAGEEVLRLVARRVNVPDGPGPLDVGDDHALPGVKLRKIRVAVVGPARI